MKAIRHTGIVVKDLGKALKFYQDVLGLKIVKRMRESGSYINDISNFKNIDITTVKLAADDGNLIEILHCPSQPVLLKNSKKLFDGGISHIAFTVENIDEIYERLLKEDVKFNSKPEKSPDNYAKVVFCRDFEGNFIELVEIL